jgi:glutamate formiminotransferase
MKRLIECVPNISEGRDHSKIEAIVAAVRQTPGALLLDVDPDADHNRTVITLSGSRKPWRRPS